MVFIILLIHLMCCLILVMPMIRPSFTKQHLFMINICLGLLPFHFKNHIFVSRDEMWWQIFATTLQRCYILYPNSSICVSTSYAVPWLTWHILNIFWYILWTEVSDPKFTLRRPSIYVIDHVVTLQATCFPPYPHEFKRFMGIQYLKSFDVIFLA